MRKVIFVMGLLISSLSAFSQSDSEAGDKRLKYGFNLGVNYSNLLENEMLPSNAAVSNNLGFRVGILADYRISKLFSVSPKAELSFNESKVNFTHNDDSQSVYEVLPMSLDFMAHFTFKDNNEKLSPYFFFGPNVRIPVSNRSEDPATFSTRADFAIDFGIGVDKSLKHFNFSPELRYSFGLLNVNQNPMIQSLYLHNISLVFNFLGK